MRRQILFPYKVISMHTNFNFTKNFILDIIQSEISLLWNDMIRVITWTKRIRWLLKKNRRFVWSFFFLYFSHRSYGFRFMGNSNTYNGNESTIIYYSNDKRSKSLWFFYIMNGGDLKLLSSPVCSIISNR